jgi:hypothetical protein
LERFLSPVGIKPQRFSKPLRFLMLERFLSPVGIKSQRFLSPVGITEFKSYGNPTFSTYIFLLIIY